MIKKVPKKEKKPTNPASFVSLDYTVLLKEYEHRLTSMERGFQMDHAFIDLWVPDEDPNKSLFYLFESAALRDQPGLSVTLSNEMLDSIDGEGLINQLGKLGGVDVQRDAKRAKLTVSFGAKSGQAANLDDIPGLSTLHRVYRDRLVRDTRVLKHEVKKDFPASGTLPKPLLAKLKVIEVSFQSGKVCAAVDPGFGIVHALGYRGMPNHVLTRMLEVLCSEVEGYSLQEIAEHGVIRLENILRDPGQPLPVRGLVTPDTAGPNFKKLNQMVRDLFAAGRKKTGIKLQRNTTERPTSEAWSKASADQRLKLVSQAAGAFLKTQGKPTSAATVLEIRQNVQVYVDLEGFASEREKRLFCRLFEKYLKLNVEERLELYLPTAEDKLKRDKRSSLVRKPDLMPASEGNLTR